MDQKVDDDVQCRTPEKCQAVRVRLVKKKKKKKKKQEDLPALEIAWMNQYEDDINKSKERLITAASFGNNIRTNSTAIKTRKQKWKKNNCMDISSDSLIKISHGKTWTWKRKLNTQQNNKSRLRGETTPLITK